VAGLLRGGDEARRQLAAARMARLAAEACAQAEPAAAARRCTELREAVLQLCEEGTLQPADARALCRQIDEALTAALEPLPSSLRALEALDRASEQVSPDELPRLALEGSSSADSAQLLTSGEGLSLHSAAGLPADPAAIAQAGSAAELAARLDQAVELADAEGARAVIALPVRPACPGAHGRLLGVLRLSSRAAWQFSDDEKRFFRALAARAGALLEPENGRIRQGQENLAALIEASPLPILSIDRHGLVQIWNRAAERLFGWDSADVIGKPSPIVPEGSEEEASGILAEAARDHTIEGREVRRQRRDGTLLDLSLSLAPLRDASGAVSGSIAVLADISGRKRREQEAKETARFREHFVGILGHELRNPLTAIVTSAQLLLRYGQLVERQAKVVGRITASADRMARMIDDLLDFARSGLGGGFPIHPRRIDLGELCEQVIDELEFAYPGRTITLAANGDLWGSWDADRISQVVSNLVANALQHGQPEAEVRVALDAEGETVLLTTHNGGPPIPREVLPHVFEPGRRGDARAGGLGLGLFIAQQIVLAHGGSIQARSSAEEGTTFTVALPRKARKRV